MTIIVCSYKNDVVWNESFSDFYFIYRNEDLMISVKKINFSFIIKILCMNKLSFDHWSFFLSFFLHRMTILKILSDNIKKSYTFCHWKIWTISVYTNLIFEFDDARFEFHFIFFVAIQINHLTYSQDSNSWKKKKFHIDW